MTLDARADRSNEARNKEVVARFMAATSSDLSILDELVADDYVDHDPIPGQEPGREGLKSAYVAFSVPFPDLASTDVLLIAEDDLVVARGNVSGTHQGDFLGIPATGKRVKWTGTRLFRLQGGKLVEGWINLDLLGLLQQLGAVPAPPKSAAPEAPSSAAISGAASTREANHALMRRFIEEVWNKGNLEVADEIFHPEATSPSAPQLPPGAEGVKVIATMFRHAFPDYWMRIDHLVADKGYVAARFSQGGTHLGDLMGIPATGKSVEWTEIGILRIADGRVVESWYDVDMVGLMGQLGVGGQA